MLVAYSGWEGKADDSRGALVRLGSIIELVHLATLVHDDILDEADTRHRQETAAKKFGPAAAVLIGDVLFYALQTSCGIPDDRGVPLGCAGDLPSLRWRDCADVSAW